MRFRATSIPLLFLLDLEPHVDERGFLARAWCSQEFAARGLASQCVQANLTYNHCRGTLRGLHFQAEPYGDAKVVRVVRGSVHDVVLDLRRESPTRGQWFACELSAHNRRGLCVPAGCAHGYLTLTDDTELLYLHSAAYHAASAAGVHWESPVLQGAWPFSPVVVSERDRQWPYEMPALSAGIGSTVMESFPPCYNPADGHH